MQAAVNSDPHLFNICLVLFLFFSHQNNDLKEENLRLKKDLENLRRTLEGDNHGENNPVKILNDQVDVLSLENEKHRQEIVKLKTDLVNRKRHWGLLVSSGAVVGTLWLQIGRFMVQIPL